MCPSLCTLGYEGVVTDPMQGERGGRTGILIACSLWPPLSLCLSKHRCVATVGYRDREVQGLEPLSAVCWLYTGIYSDPSSIKGALQELTTMIGGHKCGAHFLQ